MNDVSGVSLDPELVKDAREVDMTSSKDAGLLPRTPSDAKDERWEDYRGAMGGCQQGRS